MNFEKAKELNGKVISYLNPWDVKCIGKMRVNEIQKGQGPQICIQGQEPRYPIKVVIINELIGRDKVHGCWSISTLDLGLESFEYNLSKITLLEVVEETPSMRFSCED